MHISLFPPILVITTKMTQYIYHTVHHGLDLHRGFVRFGVPNAQLARQIATKREDVTRLHDNRRVTDPHGNVQHSMAGQGFNWGWDVLTFYLCLKFKSEDDRIYSYTMIIIRAASHLPDWSGWSYWSAHWKVAFRRIGSSGKFRKRRSKSIQYGGQLSNVLRTCSYSTNSRYIKECCQNDAICYESDAILQKSISLKQFPSLFSKYWQSWLRQSAYILYISWQKQIGFIYYVAGGIVAFHYSTRINVELSDQWNKAQVTDPHGDVQHSMAGQGLHQGRDVLTSVWNSYLSWLEYTAPWWLPWD